MNLSSGTGVEQMRSAHTTMRLELEVRSVVVKLRHCEMFLDGLAARAAVLSKGASLEAMMICRDKDE